MVENRYINKIEFNSERIKDDRNKDLVVFLAYVDDLKEFIGVEYYKLLKDAGLNPQTVYNAKAYLRAGKTRKPVINLGQIIQLSRYYSFPFDLSKYMHLLKTKEEAQNEQEQREKLKELEKF
jgi:hypothetical protein